VILFTIPQRYGQADGQADRQTDRRLSNVSLLLPSRGKNMGASNKTIARNARISSAEGPTGSLPVHSFAQSQDTIL